MKHEENGKENLTVKQHAMCRVEKPESGLTRHVVNSRNRKDSIQLWFEIEKERMSEIFHHRTIPWKKGLYRNVST